MAQHAIIRLRKLTSRGAIIGASMHNTRERMPENANPQLAMSNQVLGAQTTPALMARLGEAMAEVEETTGRRVRSDAVRAVELLLTYSPEADVHPLDYAARALEWVNHRYGEKNVLQTALHMDEKTPHLHVVIVPRTEDGRLSAREVIGGPTGLKKLQTEFAQEVGEKFGLERGVRDSRAKHHRIQEFYDRLAAEVPAELPPPTKREIAGMVRGQVPERWAKLTKIAHDQKIEIDRLSDRLSEVGRYVAVPDTVSSAKRLQEAAEDAMRRVQAAEADFQKRAAAIEKRQQAEQQRIDQERRSMYRPSRSRQKMRAADARIAARVEAARERRKPTETTTRAPRQRNRQRQREQME